MKALGNEHVTYASFFFVLWHLLWGAAGVLFFVSDVD